MKKKISLLLVLCMVLSLFAGCMTAYAERTSDAVLKLRYDDVGEEHWAYPWVTYMTERGYIHGYPSEDNNGLDMYKPGQNITRAEFATILYFMLKPQGSMTETFSDVSEDDWFFDYIDGAVAEGYMSGCGDGTMRPNDYITREEASSIVYRAFKIEKYTEATSFVDSDDISGWAYEAVMSLAQVGVVVGYTGEAEDARYVSPKTNILRAEVASLLANADKFHPSRVTLSDATVSFDSSTGKVSIDMYAKNTSDRLSVSITTENDEEFSVTYTIGEETYTVTPEEFAALVFTPEELEGLKVELTFPKMKSGEVVTIMVEVTDLGEETPDDDEIVGDGVYEITYETTGTQSPVHGDDSSYTTKYNVYFKLPDGSNSTDKLIRVKAGGTVSAGYVPENEETEYIWYDANGNKVNPTEVVINAHTTFYADYDRVVVALNAYKAMKSEGMEKPTVNTLLRAPYGVETEGFVTGNDAHNGKHIANVWWTDDLLEIIVTNDNNHLADNLEDGNYSNVVKDGDNYKLLKPIYDDVARWVVDNDDYFAEATVNSTTKHTYIKFFRAMIATIDAAAVDAAEAYWDTRIAKDNGDDFNGQSGRDVAYAAFLLAAITAAESALEEALKGEIVDYDALAQLAEDYVKALYDSVDTDEKPLSVTLDEMYTAAGGNADSFKNAVANYIAESYMYKKA